VKGFGPLRSPALGATPARAARPRSGGRRRGEIPVRKTIAGQPGRSSVAPVVVAAKDTERLSPSRQATSSGRCRPQTPRRADRRGAGRPDEGRRQVLR
jgi:hypothetical protein